MKFSRIAVLAAITAVMVASPALAVDEAGPAAAPAAAAAGAKLVGDGVYTEEQAARGMQVFGAKGCTGCHGAEMEGSPGGPALSGFNFNFKWRGKTLDGLFEFVKTQMPPGSPGTLSDQEYTDVIATIISRSGHAAGTEELTPDALASISVPMPPPRN